MEQKYSRKRRGQRRRKRILRSIVIFVYRCMCIGIAAAAVMLVLHIYQWFAGNNTKVLYGEGYPESLITLLKKNPETREFVLGYPDNIDREYEIDLTGAVTKGTIPLFLQWDERWGYEKYGSDFLAVTGCGPTCLAMVYCGLSGATDWNPLNVARMAEEHGFYVDGAGSSWILMTEGAHLLGLTSHNVVYDEAHIKTELKNGRPVICIMGPGDFTTSGHFIVLTGVDGAGKITVCDPNSERNSKKKWEAEELIPQIRNLWSYTYSE